MRSRKKNYLVSLYVALYQLKDALRRTRSKVKRLFIKDKIGDIQSSIDYFESLLDRVV